MLHDLHHVATGFGSDFTGEAEISAWEAAQGLRPLGFYTGWIVGNLALLGFVLAPRRARVAWRASKAPNLFHRPDLSYEGILEMSVAELRGLLALPEKGLSPRPRRLHANAKKR
jgi:ubiquinone biosynthesis protein Coq4